MLIGPVAVGKSTIGPLIAERLGRSFVDVDDVANPIYESLGMGYEQLFARCDADGPRAGFRWWQPALVAAVRHVVSNHPSAVIAFGAGHSHFDDDEFFDEVADLLEDATVVLLRAAADPVRSVEILRERCVSERDSDWILEGVDMLDEWERSDHNCGLADHEVVCGERTPAEIAADIVGRLARERPISGSHRYVGTMGKRSSSSSPTARPFDS